MDKVTDEPKIIESTIMSDPKEDPVLIKKTVRNVLKYFNLERKFGAKVETWSNIPIARGLKSSSAAGNAVALATVAALKKHLDDITIVSIGVDGAIDANVSITGAFDDACASYFGGVVVTDNLKRRIIKRFEISEDFAVLFYVPPKKFYTISSDLNRMKGLASLVKIAYKEALKGNYWAALTLNGLIYSSTLGYDPCIAVDALMAGALAAGLSGTGPAVTAIVPDERIDPVKNAWQKFEGEILEARINHDKAKVVG
jgi:shikimate kinase